MNVSATDRAAGGYINNSVYVCGTQTNVAARNQCNSSSRTGKAHLTAVDCSYQRRYVELCAAGDDVVACWLSMRRHADAVRPCARRRCDSITARRNWSRMYELASKRATHAFNRVSFMMFLFFLGRWRGCSSLH